MDDFAWDADQLALQIARHTPRRRAEPDDPAPRRRIAETAAGIAAVPQPHSDHRDGSWGIRAFYW